MGADSVLREVFILLLLKDSWFGTGLNVADPSHEFETA